MFASHRANYLGRQYLLNTPRYRKFEVLSLCSVTDRSKPLKGIRIYWMLHFATLRAKSARFCEVEMLTAVAASEQRLTIPYKGLLKKRSQNQGRLGTDGQLIVWPVLL
jgi:hypothetical protein